MKKIIPLVSAFFFLFTVVSAQPCIEWNNNYGFSQFSLGYQVVETLDGGYLAIGVTDTPNRGSDYYAVKVNANGIVEWERSYGGSDSDATQAVLQTSDSGFIIAGHSTSQDGDVTTTLEGKNAWVIKINKVGEMLWENSFGGSRSDSFSTIVESEDGGFVLAGSTSSSTFTGSTRSDLWVVKITSSGEEVWQANYGGSKDEGAHSIINSGDGGYVIVGPTQSSDGDITLNQGSTDAWLIKLNGEGALLWQKTYGGSKNESFCSVIKAQDGGYIVAGYTDSSDGDVSSNYGSDDIWLVKVDDNGEFEWEKTLGGSDLDIQPTLIGTADGGYAISAWSYSSDGDLDSNAGEGDYWIVKLDVSGVIQWERTIGGTGWDDPFSIIQTLDGDFVVIGEAESIDKDFTGGTRESTFWLTKLGYSSETLIEESVCGDYEVEVNGTLYNSANPSGVETISIGQECDSVVTVNLTFIDAYESNVDYFGCQGDGYDVEINGKTYNEQNPSGTELLSSVEGCDSLVTINLNFSQTSQSTLDYSGCQGDGYSVEINGITYNEQNASGTETFSTSEGCDSLVTINLNFSQTSQSTLDYSGCQGDGYSVEINGITYNEQNASGTETFSTSEGCDSLVNISLEFSTLTATSFEYNGCVGDGYEVIVNGNSYNEQNPTGVEVLSGANQCDSTVNINLSFVTTLNSDLSYIGCQGDGYEVNLNGNSYNEQNPIGVEVLSSVSGCDSTVNITLNFLSNSETQLDYNGCQGDGYGLVINGSDYDELNPTGREVLVAANGCDSIININFDYKPNSESNLEYIGCIGDAYSITLNGFTYNESNPDGVEVLQTQYGCDSIVYIYLEFYNCDDCDFRIPTPELQLNKSSSGNYSVLVKGKEKYRFLKNLEDIKKVIESEVIYTNSQRHTDLKLNSEDILASIPTLLTKMNGGSSIILK